MIKKVLFCIPPFPNRYGLPTHPHTGIGYLAQTLEDNGIKTQVFDFRLGDTFEDLDKLVKKFKPDVFGVTMMSYYHNLAYDLADQLKKYKKPIAVGGPHVSTLRKTVLTECKSADIGFLMESEKSFLAYCKGKSLKSISGIIYRTKKGLVLQEPENILDLDSVPFPKYTSVPLERYARKRIPIISSRGCPYNCIFCPIATVMGRRYRFRSAENILEELRYWYERDYRDFDFQDDNFTVVKERVFKLFDLMESDKMAGLFMQCGNGIRADLSTVPLLKRMREVGFRAIAFGVESFDEDVLLKVRKGESTQALEKGVQMALKAGLEVSLFFIVGLPGETYKSFQKSITFALKYPISTATFYNLIPFPGTELVDWVRNNGRFIIEPEVYLNTIAHMQLTPVFETKEFTAVERKKALVLGSKVNLKLKENDMKKKLGGNMMAGFLAWLLYGTVLYDVVFFLIKFSLIKRLINFVLLKLRLRLNL